MKEFKGRVVVPGTCKAEALVSKKGFNTLASFQMALMFNKAGVPCGDQNNPDIITGGAILSALIGSCSFIYIYADDDGFPRMEAIDGGNATGEIDTVTELLTEGYAVLERDSYGNPLQEAYFTPEQTSTPTKPDIPSWCRSSTGRIR